MKSVYIVLLSFISSFFAMGSDTYESLAVYNSPIYKTIKELRDKQIEVLNPEVIGPIRYYRKIFQEGKRIEETCKKAYEVNYQDRWIKEQVLNSMIATLQYKMIDLAMLNIPYYAKKLNLTEDEYNSIVDNAINNRCSKNISVISHRRIRYLLLNRYKMSEEENYNMYHGFKDFDNNLIDKAFSNRISREKLYLKKLMTSLDMFKAACTWGQSYEYPRLLRPYITNPAIMGEVIKSMSGEVIDVSRNFENIVTRKDTTTLKVHCDGIICRKKSQSQFRLDFPKSLGSNGLKKDLESLYCENFYQKEFEKEPRAFKSVEKLSELDNESQLNAVNYFLSSLTKMPNFGLWPNNAKEYRDLVESSIDAFWTTWAHELIKEKTKEAKFEDMLTLKIVPKDYFQNDYYFKMEINLDLTSGEFDEVFYRGNKLKLDFDLRMPKRDIIYLHKEYLRNWPDNKDKIRQLDLLLMSYIEDNLNKTDDFIKKYLINVSIKKLVLSDFRNQIMGRQDLNFKDGNKNQSRFIVIPVKLHIGNFALIYLKNRRLMLSGMRRELEKEKLYQSSERLDTLENSQ